MKKTLLTISFCLIQLACATTTSITNSSPGFVIIDGPRLSGCGQFVTNMAQEHCQKTGKNAVLVDGWVRPFQSDACRYECKN